MSVLLVHGAGGQGKTRSAAATSRYRAWAEVLPGVRPAEAGRPRDGLPWARRGCDEMTTSPRNDPHLIQPALALNMLELRAELLEAWRRR
ncbi:hypothetical protein ACFXGA_11245 [Actinosynnema sp. NPDC059335]|uniref:hypothetical protein n=1 Tax=Actinosynnema sp. NPDC059335 TaxID=3346804 RepID=UPI00366FA51F